MEALRQVGPEQVQVLEAVAAGRVTWRDGVHLLDGARMRCRQIVPVVLGGFARYELTDTATFAHEAVLTAAGVAELEQAWGLVA